MEMHSDWGIIWPNIARLWDQGKEVATSFNNPFSREDINAFKS